MKRIGIISDTHGYWDDKYLHYFEPCDEIWHAGDIGTTELAERLAEFRPLRAVCGNCDGGDLDLQQNIFNKDAEPTALKPAADAGAGDVPMTVQTGTGRVPTPNDKMIQEKQNDKKEWEKAVQDNTIEAYERYKASYPGGEYVAQANEKIEEMKRKESFGSRWGIFKRKIKDFITEAEDE